MAQGWSVGRVSRYLGRWLLLAPAVAVLGGSAAALFLVSLSWVTDWREGHHWIIAALPLAGLAMGWAYHRHGREVDGGVSRVLREIHLPAAVLQLRMAPMVLVATLGSHLFGASVGREGTAVQMGASLADQLSRWVRLSADERRILLLSGMAAGFSAMFGTPLAGAVFAMEVMRLRRARFDALLPCVLAALLADRVCLAWGVHHMHYVVSELPGFTLWAVGATVAAGIAFGLMAWLFVRLGQWLGAWVARRIPSPMWRPFWGGVVVAALVFASGGYRYVGIGIGDIQQAFSTPMQWWDGFAKLGFTVLSLSTGFKGGEVTPLFYMGATLGSALSPWLVLPVSMAAGMGFVAVFAGAAKVPLACSVMAMELFGPMVGPWMTLACFVAWLCAGPRGVYQRP